METFVWNPAAEPLPISIVVNDKASVTTEIGPGEYKVIRTPVLPVHDKLKITLRGDRTLVVLQSGFN
jgi:hypothetical protein